MGTIQKLTEALIQEKGFIPIQQSALPSVQAFPAEGYDFIGIRKYVGSVVSIALVKADTLGEQELIRCCERFSQLTEVLQKHAGTLWVGLAPVRLGSFGVLCFVFECQPNETTIRLVQRQKRVLFRRKVHSLCWVIDARAGKISPHRGLPFTGVFPGQRYIEGVLGRG